MERWRLPTEVATWLSLGYLVVVGSVGLFMLFLYVLVRWSATATSYSLLLMPLVTIVAGAIVLDEPVRVPFLAGAALVLAGVYIAALAPSADRARATVMD
jgi:drug/metabolite transporter (DMT)-like permease